MLIWLVAYLRYKRVSGGVCLGSLTSPGPGSHSVLMRASHLALLLNVIADVGVSLPPHFLIGSLGKGSGASSRESHGELSGSAEHCSMRNRSVATEL